MEINFQEVMNTPRDVLTERLINGTTQFLTNEQHSALKQMLHEISDEEFYRFVYSSLYEAAQHPTNQKEFSELSTELIQKFGINYKNTAMQNVNVDIIEPEENRILWRDINLSKTSDVIYLTSEEDKAIKNLWTHEMKEDDIRFIPSDIIFANTIPIMDFGCVVDETKTGGCVVKFRTVIFPDYQKRIDTSDEENSVTIGALITDIDNRIFYFPLSVCKGVDKILTSGNVGYRNVSNEELYRFKKGFTLSHAMLFTSDCLATWYGVQIALLHPTVKEIFKNPKSEPVEVIVKKKNKKPRKRIARYMKKHVINITAFEEALYGGKDKKFERHTLVWYVIGHWRTYKNGKKIFIQPYWKGALREIKMNLDEREREIILPESEVVTESN